MPPFPKTKELVSDLNSATGAPQPDTLPGHPSVLLNDSSQMKEFLEQDLCSVDLERMAPYLWIMTTLSSGNINPLHRQKVKGREIVVTEEPRLHLVWIHYRIFIKPLSRYLLSYAFWDTYLDTGLDRQSESQTNIRKAALGFLRTYRYLIQHESDFYIAQRDDLRLIPKDIEWAAFCRLTSDLKLIEDTAVSGRYCFGELRLTRLNLYAPLLLHKFHFEQVHGQYGDFFARLYGPILFVFAIVSTILSSMQVALAAEQLVAAHWVSIWYVSRWFSVLSLMGASVVTVWFMGLWLWIFLDEWVYTIRRKVQKRREHRLGSKC